MSDTPNAIYSHKKFKKAALEAEKKATDNTLLKSSRKEEVLKDDQINYGNSQQNYVSDSNISGAMQYQYAGNCNGNSSNEIKHIFKPKFQADYSSAKSKSGEQVFHYQEPPLPPLQRQYSVDNVIFSSSVNQNISEPSQKSVLWKGLNSASLEEVSQHITHLIDQNAAIVESNKPEKLGKLKRYPSLTCEVDGRTAKRSNNSVTISLDRRRGSYGNDMRVGEYRNDSKSPVASEPLSLPPNSKLGFEVNEKDFVSSHPASPLFNSFPNEKVKTSTEDAHGNLQSVDRGSFTTLSHKLPVSPKIKESYAKNSFFEKSGDLMNFTSIPKANSNHIYGGEVKIYGNVCKTLIIDSTTTKKPSLDLSIATQQLATKVNELDTPRSIVVTFAQSGLNSGGTMVKIGKTSQPVDTGKSSHLYSSSGIDCEVSNERGTQNAATKSSTNSCVIFPVPSPTRNKIKYVPGIPGPYSEALEYYPRLPSASHTQKASDAVEIVTKSNRVKYSSSENPTQPAPLIKIGYCDNNKSNSHDILQSKNFLRSIEERPRSLKLLSPTPLSSVALIGSTLISPDTPRPKKSCGQHFLDGSAYTYLNMKVSTRTFFCCIYRPQPVYVPQPPNSKLSMYSNWQIRKSENPLNIGPVESMSLHRLFNQNDRSYVVSSIKEMDVMTPSSYWYESRKQKEIHKGTESPEPMNVDDVESEERMFKVDEECSEKYIRGRGRGRYVCNTCGIRCHKPSMLKKHIRTHSDVRPYMCTHCVFSFKTKGNLTKHLKSKTHFKKCSNVNFDFPYSRVSTRDLSPDQDERMQDDEYDIDEESEDCDYLCDNDSSYSDSPHEPRISCDTRDIDAPIDLSMKTCVRKDNTEVLPEIGHPFELLKTIYNTSVKVSASDGTVLQRNLCQIDGKSGDMLKKYLEELAMFDVTKKALYVPKKPVPMEVELSCGCSGTCQCKESNEVQVPKSPKTLPDLPANITVVNSSGDNNGISFMSPSGKIPSTRSNKYFDELALEDGKCTCSVCNKKFAKGSQLSLHMQVHAFERNYRCHSCGVSFRAKGHLSKHKRSVSHSNKVSINNTFGTPSTENPRPFKCSDCDVAFRIHGHLAKHLRSKLHVMRLECLGKVPFGIYAELERCGMNLHNIDTTDCESSLESFQSLASNLFDKDGNTSSNHENKQKSQDSQTHSDEQTKMDKD